MVTVPDVVGDHVIVNGLPTGTACWRLGADMGLQPSVHSVVCMKRQSRTKD
jgi:hypothetical protein